MMWRKGTLVHCWWECRLVQPLWKAVWSFLKKLKVELPYDPAILLLGIYPQNPNTLIGKNICTSIFIAVLFTIAKIWKHPECLSVDEWIKQLRDICTMEYHLTEKEETFTLCDSVDIDLKNIMLSEISQSEKNKYHVISVTCGI